MQHKSHINNYMQLKIEEYEKKLQSVKKSLYFDWQKRAEFKLTLLQHYKLSALNVLEKIIVLTDPETDKKHATHVGFKFTEGEYLVELGGGFVLVKKRDLFLK